MGIGNLLASKYSQSMRKLLCALYPNYEWLPWRFPKVSSHYMEDIENQKKIVDWAGKELKIEQLSDWYKITNKVAVFFSVFLLERTL